MTARRAIWFGGLWLLAGCPSASEREFDPREYAELRCAHISACAPEWLDAFPGGTEQACRDTLTCTEVTFFLPANGCAAGHDVLCKALAMKGLPCDARPAGEGESCSLSGDCRAGLACDTSSGCGVCRPAVGLGEACSYAGMCGPPPMLCDPAQAFCDQETSTCKLRRERGEACRFSDECRDGLCILSECGPQRGAGEPCEQFYHCQGYLACRAGVCAPRGRTGAACGLEGPDCQEGLQCFRGQCIEALCKNEPREVGSPCSGLDCGEGLFCDAETERCARVLPLGAACTSAPGGLASLGGDECGTQGYCSAELLCARRKAEGESCKDAACEPLLACLPPDCDLTCGCSFAPEDPLVCRKVELPQCE